MKRSTSKQRDKEAMGSRASRLPTERRVNIVILLIATLLVVVMVVTEVVFPAKDTQILALADLFVLFSLIAIIFSEEKKVKEVGDLFWQLSNAALDSVIVIDDKGKIVFWNEAAEKTFGWDQQEAIGRDLHQLIVPQGFQEEFQKKMPEFLKTGRGAITNKVLLLPALRKGGESFQAEHSISAIKVGGRFYAVGIVRDITDRLRAETALREREESFRNLVERLPNLVFRGTPADGPIYVNPAVESILGYKPADVLHKPGFFLSILHPEDQLLVIELFQEVGAQRRTFSQREVRMKKKSGKYLWFDVCLVYLYNEAGEIVSFEASAHETTLLKQAEAIAQLQTDVLRSLAEGASTKALFDQITKGIQRVCGDVECKAIILNEQTGVLELVSAPSMSRELVQQVKQLEGNPPFWCSEQAREQKKAFSIPDLESSDAPETWKGMLLKIGIRAVFVVPVLSSVGQLLGSLCLSYREPREPTDLERKVSEECAQLAAEVIEKKKLEARERRFGRALDQTSDLVFVTDREGEIEYVNPAFTKVTGYTLKEVRGQTPRVLKSGEHEEAFYQKLWKTILGGDSFQAIFVNKKKSGELYEEEKTITPMVNKDGEITNFIAIGRDLSQMRKMEQELLQAQKMESIGKLAGGVAHDFNNILTALLGNAELAKDLSVENPAVLECVEEVLSAAHRASDLTRQLLAFSRRQTIQLRVVDLHELISGMRKLLVRLIEESIQLKIVCAEGEAKVKVDPGQIEQVLLNLAVNARDAMPKGGLIRIETSFVEIDEAYTQGQLGVSPGSYWQIAVSDTGMGMEPALLGKIFEPFFTTKEKGKGTGLGLSTVYGIIKQHGGDIHVYSEVGRGTTFKIYLPSCDEERRQQMRESNGYVRGQGEVILLVEDDSSARQTITQILQKLGYVVLSAVNADDALRVLAEHGELKPSLLITDIIMPGRSGKELADEVVKLFPKINVLFISGYTEDNLGQHGIVSKEVNFLEKPFSISDLAETVRRVLDQSPSD